MCGCVGQHVKEVWYVPMLRCVVVWECRPPHAAGARVCRVSPRASLLLSTLPPSAAHR